MSEIRHRLPSRTKLFTFNVSHYCSSPRQRQREREAEEMMQTDTSSFIRSVSLTYGSDRLDHGRSTSERERSEAVILLLLRSERVRTTADAVTHWSNRRCSATWQDTSVTDAFDWEIQSCDIFPSCNNNIASRAKIVVFYWDFEIKRCTTTVFSSFVFKLLFRFIDACSFFVSFQWVSQRHWRYVGHRYRTCSTARRAYHYAQLL